MPFATASADTTIKIWDAADGRLLQTLTGHTASVDSVQFSDDGTQLISGSADLTMRVWDLSFLHSL